MNNNTKKENVGSQEEKDIESNLTALGEHIVERRHEKSCPKKLWLP